MHAWYHDIECETSLSRHVCVRTSVVSVALKGVPSRGYHLLYFWSFLWRHSSTTRFLHFWVNQRQKRFHSFASSLTTTLSILKTPESLMTIDESPHNFSFPSERGTRNSFEAYCWGSFFILISLPLVLEVALYLAIKMLRPFCFLSSSQKYASLSASKTIKLPALCMKNGFTQRPRLPFACCIPPCIFLQRRCIHKNPGRFSIQNIIYYFCGHSLTMQLKVLCTLVLGVRLFAPVVPPMLTINRKNRVQKKNTEKNNSLLKCPTDRAFWLDISKTTRVLDLKYFCISCIISYKF